MEESGSFITTLNLSTRPIFDHLDPEKEGIRASMAADEPYFEPLRESVATIESQNQQSTSQEPA